MAKQPSRQRFVKLGPTGKRLPITAAEWVAVYDRLLDLTWSRTIGTRAVKQPKAVEIAAAVNLFGATDWRLSTRAELVTLVDDTRVKPATNIEFFPNCRPSWYWTSTPYASSPSLCAWSVLFHYGNSGWHLQNYEAFVRAVRSGQ